VLFRSGHPPGCLQLLEQPLLASLEQWLTPFLSKVNRLSHFAGLDLPSILQTLLPWPLPQRLDELAPRALTVPSGSRIAIDYGEQPPVLAVRLQELFGLAATPRIAGGRQGLKLHLLSHRLVKPHGLSLAGIFPLLPNVAWTSQGAVDLSELAERQLEARLKGKLLEVFSVDKFPKMTDYVVPAGVRIADSARVRLGAYIGEGTTVMHEGFVNFNGGTEGPGMIEGRVSAGVFVGKGSDLGGGCSTMGTLSGGGNIIISVGEGCLIGANAGIGIPLGDRNTVEAGLYITAGTKVNLLDEGNALVKVVKARDLAGQPDLDRKSTRLNSSH